MSEVLSAFSLIGSRLILNKFIVTTLLSRRCLRSRLSWQRLERLSTHLEASRHVFSPQMCSDSVLLHTGMSSRRTNPLQAGRYLDSFLHYGTSWTGFTILLIIGGIELNPGPKRQTTLTPAISPATHETADSDLKVLILNLSTEMKSMRERLDSGLAQIGRRLEEWDKRAQEMETKITQSMEAQRNTDKRVVSNTLQLHELEARMEYTEARLREQNLIFYGIVREENENPFDCNRKVKSIITDKMGLTDEVKITKFHRLSRAENSPVLAVIPDHEEEQDKDYSLKVRDQRRILIAKRKELFGRGIKAKLRDNKLIIDDTTYSVVNGEIVNSRGNTI
ncbi:hypothetical protein LAZ67_4003835 [Cordylochernes scorpioides]|uniref:Uncharacterized protein n=1 Tax=Cordylochernes scorpioides TaxID=51811 RepID=A0ABY6KE07_9ARAC|nr:hypothetical protein LAZ67_4003835 [Cordylochernes scorpioides]